MKLPPCLTLACVVFWGCDRAVTTARLAEPRARVSTTQFYPVVSFTPELKAFETGLGCITNGHVRAFWNLVHPDTLAKLTPEERRKGLEQLENITDYTLSVYHCDDENEFQCAYLARLDCTRLDPAVGDEALRLYLHEKDGAFSIVGGQWIKDAAK